MDELNKLSEQIWLKVLVHPKVCSLGAVGALASEFYFTSLPESCVHGIWNVAYQNLVSNSLEKERSVCSEQASNSENQNGAIHHVEDGDA